MCIVHALTKNHLKIENIWIAMNAAELLKDQVQSQLDRKSNETKKMLLIKFKQHQIH